MPAFIVEDRETAFLFRNHKKAPDGAVVCSVEIDPSVADKLEDERVALWLANDDNSALRVVPFDGFDFKNCGSDGFFPIPTPIVVEDIDEYRRLKSS